MISIAGVPLLDNPPNWQSSSPTPLYHLKNIHPTIKEFKEYNYDDRLADLLKNKKIAYVGPSPHLKGLNLGSYIDSHDIVVRINQAYHVPEKEWKDYGKRTDIVVNCLNIYKRSALQKNMSFVNSLKFIICPMINMTELSTVNGFLQGLKIPSHNVCDGYLLKFFEQVGTICNTGLSGIVTLLNYDIESIYVAGMSFYNMNKFGVIYSETYYDEAAKNKNFTASSDRRPSIRELRIDIHHQDPQIKYFAKMLEHNYPNKLKVDDYLVENFKLIV